MSNLTANVFMNRISHETVKSLKQGGITLLMVSSSMLKKLLTEYGANRCATRSKLMSLPRFSLTLPRFGGHQQSICEC